MFSRVVSCGNTLVIWNDFATPIWAKQCCGKPVTSRPSNSTLPLDVGSGQDTGLKFVLLPRRLGPMIEVIAPLGNSAEILLSATNLPNFLPTPEVRRMISGDAVAISVMICAA